ncbi:pyruvate dehydrogenase (acetyl-transferring) E1 component subunit alpha, partial [Crocinitomicaceae bacterium]|nr:pyruvate dehydrogenase (acetyl-transferring) E1 component subunit alpha [Crocinitomicaceae bacterium]
EEVAEWQEQDPIEHCLRVIQDNKWMTAKQIEEVSDWVKKEVDESVKFAEGSPYPEGKDLYDDIYKEPDYPYIVEY